MYTLLYISKYRKTLTDSEIDTMVQTSGAYNASKDITGCLITYKGKCVQILEGPETEIKKLYSRVKSDPRHYEVHILSENPIDERAFPQFAMSYLPIKIERKDSQALERLRTNVSILSDFTNPVHKTAVLFWKKIREFTDTFS
ncbi:BLUF domain-containing protein [Zobellia sp. OII3]|uniref:BLUF domain-containing protein n=1 Tax=Zobellia sp. OII3 TaxID=2034520 RepID=UPI000F4DDB01|nr:BLUF domain-containing protein [Zobellia sp. OII3]